MKKIYNIAFWCLLCFIAVAYTTLAFGKGLWYDEAYSMAMIRHGFGEICTITAQDVHPPLYYFMLKIFCAPFGYGIFAARIFSVIPLLLTMLLGYFKLSDIINKKTGLLFALMFSLLPIMSMFSVQIRMYGWAALEVTGCGLFAYTAFRDEDVYDYIIFTLFGVMAAYTHYFALVSVGIIYIMLFIGCIRKKKIKNFIFSAIAAVILYLPWFAAFFGQLAEKVESEYWIAPITLSTVGEYFRAWFKCGRFTNIYLIGIIIIAIVSAALLIVSGDKKLRKTAALFSLVFVMTNIIGIAASIIVRPVFIERYAVPAIPLLLAAVAAGLGLIERKVAAAAVAVFFFAGFCINYPAEVEEEYNAPEINLHQTLEEANYEAIICYVDSHLYGVLSFYSEDTPVYRPKLSKGSPFDNIFALSDFNREECKWAAVFVPKGEEVPPEASDGFNVDYVKTVSTYGIESDMYSLWK